MNKSSLAITLIMGALAALLWGIVNAPDYEPSWPSKVQGFSFSPLRVQAVPFGAALFMSLVGGLPRLPASLVGPMGPLRLSTQDHP